MTRTADLLTRSQCGHRLSESIIIVSVLDSVISVADTDFLSLAGINDHHDSQWSQAEQLRCGSGLGLVHVETTGLKGSAGGDG